MFMSLLVHEDFISEHEKAKRWQRYVNMTRAPPRPKAGRGMRSADKHRSFRKHIVYQKKICLFLFPKVSSHCGSLSE